MFTDCSFSTIHGGSVLRAFGRRLLARAASITAVVILCSPNAIANDWSPLWTTATLSQPRYLLSATSAEGKAYFAGGYLNGYVATKVVDVYDTTTGVWSSINLPQARHALAATSIGAKVIFGGGGVDGAVDIFDSTTNTWSTASLSKNRSYLAAASCGGKSAFGGGYSYGQIPYPYSSAAVDIYKHSEWHLDSNVSVAAAIQSCGRLRGQ